MPQFTNRGYRNLARQVELDGIETAMSELAELLETRQVRPEEFSIKSLAENLVEDGINWVRAMDPNERGSIMLRESNAVSTSDFTNITGQIAFSRILDAYNDAKLIGDMLVTTVPTRLDGEKIPGMTRVGDGAETIQEGRDYPTLGFSEDYIETPKPVKRGFIVPVTKEAIFFDRTNLILSRASEAGHWLAVNREKRIIDTVIGTTTSYRRGGAAAAATYGDTPWDNLSASTPLKDATSVETAELLFDAMTDPFTGEPIMTSPDVILVPTGLLHTAQLILGGTVTKTGEPGVTNAVSYMTKTGSSYIDAGQYRIISSPYVKARSSSATTWWIGQPKKAFAYMENWGVSVEQAPTNSEDEFKRDIVIQFKASERGAAAVLDPRFMVKATA